MSYTLRLTKLESVELSKIKKSLGEKTSSKALIYMILNYLTDQTNIKNLSLQVAEARDQLFELKTLLKRKEELNVELNSILGGVDKK